MLLIDPPAWPAHGRLWSHLVSDTSFEELHAFAARTGIPRQGFEGDHYDIPEERYAAVVAAGAVPLDSRDLLKRLRDSGLRISKRKHERVVESTPEASWLPPGSRADVIASRQDNPPPNTVVVRAAVRGSGGLLVIERADGRGLDLPTRTVGEGEGGEDSLRTLCDSVGVPADGAALLGYVRHVVPHPSAAYSWPTPMACFAVYTVAADGGAATTGIWLPPESQGAELGERHWWPLINPDAQGQGHAHP